MAKKKKTESTEPTALAVTATQKSISAAGIADFRMTKEDMIELLVEEAVAEASKNLPGLRERSASLVKEMEDLRKEHDEYIHTAVKALPVFVELRKVLPSDTRVDDVHLYTNYSPSSLLERYAHACMKKDSKYQDILNRIAKNKKDHQQNYQELCEVETEVNNIRNSSKKMRLELVKSVLNNSGEGQALLENLKNISANMRRALQTPMFKKTND